MQRVLGIKCPLYLCMLPEIKPGILPLDCKAQEFEFLSTEQENSLKKALSNKLRTESQTTVIEALNCINHCDKSNSSSIPYATFFE